MRYAILSSIEFNDLRSLWSSWSSFDCDALLLVRFASTHFINPDQFPNLLFEMWHLLWSAFPSCISGICIIQRTVSTKIFGSEKFSCPELLCELRHQSRKFIFLDIRFRTLLSWLYPPSLIIQADLPAMSRRQFRINAVSWYGEFLLLSDTLTQICDCWEQFLLLFFERSGRCFKNLGIWIG